MKENILNDRVEPVESDEHKILLKVSFIPLLYIKWTIIVFRFPKLYRDIKGNRKRLIDLQEAAGVRGEAGVVEGEGEKVEKKGI
ncbi:MAG: hypothetical protein ACE5D4_10265 [Thermodesulfobacteriota bacterium]